MAKVIADEFNGELWLVYPECPYAGEIRHSIICIGVECHHPNKKGIWCGTHNLIGDKTNLKKCPF